MSVESNKVEKTVGTVAGERSLPSVNTAKRSGNNMMAIIFVGVALLLTFAYGYFSFFGKKKGNKDEEKAERVTVSTTAPFISAEPIDFTLPKEEKPEIVEKEKEKPEEKKKEVKVRPRVEPPKPVIDHSSSGLMVASKDKKAAASSAQQKKAKSQKPEREDDSNLAEKLVATKTEKVQATQLRNRHYLLAKGSMINCSLQTQIDTSVPGFVSCVTTRDVYGDTGTVLLLERGTQVVGEYQSNIEEGVNRLFILWTRAKTPNGVVVDLDSPAADPLGGAGVAGYVNHRFWQRFGSALLLSVFNTAYTTATNIATIDMMNRQDRKNKKLELKAQMEANNAANAGVVYYPNGNNNSAGVNIDLGNAGQPLNDIISQILAKQANIPETMTKNRGESIAIFVARDLDFSGVYDAQPE